MRPEPWLVIGLIDPLPAPPIPPRFGIHRLSELIAWLKQLAQRLLHFQHRYPSGLPP
jgi:hypothetical protein